MTRTTFWPEGTPCWAELEVPVPERAGTFYAAVLGWTITSGEETLLARHGGRAVASVRTGSRATWTVWFAVDDADEAAERIEELGGAILEGPSELPGPGDRSDAGGTDAGRIVVALDPGGMEFGGWEAGDHVGADALDEPGTMTGADAASGEPGQSRTFYERLFAFRHEPAPDAENHAISHAIHHGDGRPLGRLEIAGDELPHWLVRFAVPDLDAALAAASSAGAEVSTTSDTATSHTATSRPARSAIVRDPDGARFGVVEIGAV